MASIASKSGGGGSLFEAHRALGNGVHEAELDRVEHRPRRRDERAREAADVDGLADERMAGLGEVDANLMGAPGLEATGQERGASEALERLEVGDGELPLAASLGDRAAEAVAAIRDDVRANRRLADVAVSDREVAPERGVLAELLAEVLLRRDRARKDDEPGGLLVEPLDDAEGARPRTESRRARASRTIWSSVTSPKAFVPRTGRC